MRTAVIISRGRKPALNGLGEKYVSSSDEAFVLVTVENYYRRFKYTAQCKTDNTAVDKKHSKCMCRWTDDKAGQKEFGGWDKEGTARYAALHSNIVTEKKKNHVVAVETSTLAYVRGTKLEELTGDDGDLVDSDDDDDESEHSAMVARAKTSFIDFDSDNDEVEVVEIEDLADNYTKKSKRARKAK